MIALHFAILLSGAWALAQLADRLGLPPLLGMIAAGIVAGNWVLPLLPAGSAPLTLVALSPHVRVAVLAVVLLRAGLGLSRADLGAAGPLALRLGLVPMLTEAAVVALAGALLVGLPPSSAVALGFLVAAISPAIVIPATIELLHQRHGPARRVPAALLAGAPLDNIAAVVALGATLDIALSPGASIAWSLARVPYAVVGAVVLGGLVGLLLARILRPLGGWEGVVLWGCAGALVPPCRALGVSFVIAIVMLGLVVRARAPRVLPGAGDGLTRIWSWAQLVLFSLIGAALDVAPLSRVGLVALALIALGLAGRALGVWLATTRSNLGDKERLACVVCYLPKATIQAAFGALPLDRGLAGGGLLLSTAVLAIAITAPLGLIAIHRFADRLLPRDVQPRGG